MSLRFQQKLIIPATARPLVERPRLLTELEQVITTRRVVALAAPAGWGKTTTLAQWAAGSSLPVAWYTLDPADRDPQSFSSETYVSGIDFLVLVADLIEHSFWKPSPRDSEGELAGLQVRVRKQEVSGIDGRIHRHAEVHDIDQCL